VAYVQTRLKVHSTSVSIVFALTTSSLILAHMATARPTDDQWFALKVKRQRLLTKLEKVRKDIEKLKRTKDSLKKKGTPEAEHELDCVYADLFEKEEDLHELELDVKDLDISML
jgi:chromosome segregation ATPase